MRQMLAGWTSGNGVRRKCPILFYFHPAKPLNCVFLLCYNVPTPHKVGMKLFSILQTKSLTRGLLGLLCQCSELGCGGELTALQSICIGVPRVRSIPSQLHMLCAIGSISVHQKVSTTSLTGKSVGREDSMHSKKCEKCRQPLGVSMQKDSRLESLRTWGLQSILASGVHRFSPRRKLPVFLIQADSHTVTEHQYLAVLWSSALKGPLGSFPWWHPLSHLLDKVDQLSFFSPLPEAGILTVTINTPGEWAPPLDLPVRSLRTETSFLHLIFPSFNTGLPYACYFTLWLDYFHEYIWCKQSYP